MMKKSNGGCSKITISLDKTTSRKLDRYLKVMSQRDGHDGIRWGARSQVVQKALKQYLRLQEGEVRF